MKYILFNPLSNNHKGADNVAIVKEKIGEATECSVLDLDLRDFVSKLNNDDQIYILGGDGTINKFINRLGGVVPKQEIYLFKSGSGNDFLNDVKENETGDFVLLNKYLENLPTVEVNGNSYFFINGVGFGIDGYCCEVGDKMREEKPGEEINYTKIAIKGLLFKFKKVNATVEVDGVSESYKNVWLAPTMKGRFYGGGMMIAPAQDRFAEDKSITNVIYKTRSKLKALINFPSIFKGEHVNKKGLVVIRKGSTIKVTFDKPCALQVDGETILNVTTYTAHI